MKSLTQASFESVLQIPLPSGQPSQYVFGGNQPPFSGGALVATNSNLSPAFTCKTSVAAACAILSLPHRDEFGKSVSGHVGSCHQRSRKSEKGVPSSSNGSVLFLPYAQRNHTTNGLSEHT